MKRLLLVILTLCIMFPLTVNADSRVTYMNYTIGENRDYNGAWIQGLETTKNTIYLWDYFGIKKGENGTLSTYFHLSMLADELEPYDLDNEHSYFSFILGDMQLKGDTMYVSGLIFRDAQFDQKQQNGKQVVGETYSILFKIDKSGRKTYADLLHISKAKTFTDVINATRFNENYERRDLIVAVETDYLQGLLHFETITPPRFTFDGEDVIMVRDREKDDKDYADIIRVTKHGDQLLHTIDLDEDRENYRHILPYIEGNYLYVHDEKGFYREYMPMDWGRYHQLTKERMFLRPTYKDGEVYFLNDTGFLTLNVWTKKHDYIVKAKDISHRVDIHDYDWNTERGGVLYTTDWLRKRDFWAIRIHK